MKKPLALVIAALACALVPTLIAYLLLDPGSGLLYLVLFVLLSVGLAYGRTMVSRRVSGLLLAAQAIIYVFAVAVIVVSLNLTPSSAYLAWFRIAQDGGAAGMLSFMFTVKICFFSTFFGATIIRYGVVRPVAAMSSIVLIILYAIYQIPSLGYIAAGLLLASAITLVANGPRRFRRRNIRILITLAILAALAAIPLSLIEPKPTNPMVDTFDQSGLSKAVVKVYPEFPFLYNMPGYGHQLGRRDIGDRPSLTARPVFEVTGIPGQTVYLRTAVFEFYTGSGWSYNENRLAEAEFSYGTMFKTSKDDEFDNPLEVEVLIDFFSSVPHTVNTSAIMMGKGQLPELAYGSTDTGFLFDIPVTKGTRFLLQQNRSTTDVEEPDDTYLTLPANVPADAIDLSQLLGVTGEPLQTAKKIKDYLTYNYYYTLEPSAERQFDDPAWEFLLSAGEGYCVHFATSFVLLARMNNIPARYVTGFLVNIPSDSASATVTGFSSHAWAEIWQPGVGWIVQEATPPMLPEFFDDPSFYEMYNPFQSRYTAMQLESIMGARVSQSPVEREPGLKISIDPAPVALALIGAALLAAAYYLTFHSIYTFGSAGRKIRLISRKMILRGMKEGVDGPESSGWVTWAEEVGQIHPGESGHLSRSVDLMQAGFFGGKPRGGRDVKFIRRTFHRVFGRRLSTTRKSH